MRLAPITVKRAIPFCRHVHRRLPNVQGGMWAVSVVSSLGISAGEELAEADLIGVAIVGHAARALGPLVLSVLRVAVIEGHPNACSMLYGACSRAAKALGCDDLVTYTHQDELGASLIASGWVCGGETEGGEYDRPSRRRRQAVDPLPKLRWWAPWGKRAQAILSDPEGGSRGYWTGEVNRAARCAREAQDAL